MGAEWRLVSISVIILMVRYRALIFEDDDASRALLWELCDERGYEVFTFPDPGACPLFHQTFCECPLEESCCDFLISDLNMPVASGLDYIERQKRKGCRCPHIALITGTSSLADVRAAEGLGCKVFPKPLSIEKLYEWLDRCESQIRDGRKLSDWLCGGAPEEMVRLLR